MANRNIKIIDLNRFPRIDSIHAWITLDDSLKPRIIKLPKVSDRILNAVRFIWFAQGESTLINLGKDLPRLREGFIRAALAELVSAEEVLRLDLQSTGRKGAKIFRMNDSLQPHLHIVRELRHHELHLHHNKVAKFERNLLWGRLDKPELATPITVSLWVLEGLTFKSFSALNNAKNYNASDLRAMIDWFNKTQTEWGVNEILLCAVNNYVEELCAFYNL